MHSRLTCCSGDRRALVEHDEGANCLTEQLVRYANDGCLAHAGDAVQNVLHLDRTHLLSSCLDDVVGAADEIQIAVGIHREEVVRAQHALTGKAGRA